MIALIAVLTFLLLARAFRSLLLPLKAVILNVISVAAAWGVITLVWQQGHGSNVLWGIAATHSVTAWIPLMVFAFLFGLSMDYEVFILSRMREEYDRTGSTDGAVITGIGRTGRLVTSAALILFLAFVSMSSGPETDVKVFATGLAAGILLDATLIRALLVPAVVSLFGRWNWWLPARSGPAGCGSSPRCRRRPHRKAHSAPPENPRQSGDASERSSLRALIVAAVLGVASAGGGVTGGGGLTGTPAPAPAPDRRPGPAQSPPASAAKLLGQRVMVGLPGLVAGSGVLGQIRRERSAR